MLRATYIGQARPKSAPDVIDRIVPSGIMSLAVCGDPIVAAAVWGHAHRCLQQNHPVFGSFAARRGKTVAMPAEPGRPLPLRPAAFYMATPLVWIDLTGLQDSLDTSIRLDELREAFQSLVQQHWYAAQPGFVVSMCDVFDCGPEGVWSLAEGLFGRLARAAIYVEGSMPASEEDTPSRPTQIRVWGADLTVECDWNRASGAIIATSRTANQYRGPG
jgi:hypothetical protein